jgi:hypothetical protein
MGRGLLFLAGPLSLTGWQHVPVLRPLCVQVSPKEPALMLAKVIDSHVMEGGAEVSLFFGVMRAMRELPSSSSSFSWSSGL